MSLEELKRSRVAARGWLKRAIVRLDRAISAQDTVELEFVISEFDNRLANLDSIQAKIELVLPDDEVEEDVAKASEARDEAIECRIRAIRALRAKTEAAAHEVGSISAQSQAVRLPKLELPKFSGDILEWSTFWDQFEASVDCSDLPEVSKFVYLRSLLVGEARKCVEGLAVVKDNYVTACQLLKERFARPAAIIFAHIEKLLKLGSKDQKDLKMLQDELLLHVRSLERLGITGDQFGVILTPLILSRLPLSFRLEWARDSAEREGDLSYLLESLKHEIERKERCRTVAGSPVEAAGAEESARAPRGGRAYRPPAASALHASSARGSQRAAAGADGPTPRSPTARPRPWTARSPKCALCWETHITAECQALRSLTVPDRNVKVKEAGLCFACLRAGHHARHCSARCGTCKRRHHVVLCPQGETCVPQSSLVSDHVSDAAGAGSSGGPVTVSLSCGDKKQTSTRQCTVLPTAKVLVYGSKGVVEATVLFDSGSDRTYVTESLVKRVGAEWVASQPVSFAAFGGGKASSGDRNVYKMSVKGASVPSCEVKSFTAVSVPVICAPLSRPSVPLSQLSDFHGMTLAEDSFTDRTLCVDILIGLDCYWTMMRSGVVISSSGLTAQDSCFGWVVSGAATDVHCNASLMTCRLLCLGDLSPRELRNFWELEGIGVSSKEGETLHDDAVLQQFESSVRFVEGRYEVALPKKEDSYLPELQSNLPAAVSRLRSLSRRLDRDDELHSQYDDVLHSMENSGVIEEVPESEVDGPSGRTYYMPHRPVLRPESSSTKVRPVFDASAAGANGISLNDCLEAGPSLIPNLTDVLLRFRRHQFAVTGDISKAFLQISVRPDDRDYLRFLWDDGGQVRHMRFCRVPFGVSSSPFLLNATVKHHLCLCPQSDSTVVSELQNNLYVDDWLTGADTEAAAKQLFLDGKEILSRAGMTLSKCHSNSEVVLDGADASQYSEEDRLKILGVRWDPTGDVLRYDGVHFSPDVVPTKRVLLSFLARMFDPLGFLVPFLMVLKMLFQQLWMLGLEWDEPLDDELSETFLRWVTGLSELPRLRIPRCYMLKGVCWSDVRGIEIHVFADASTKGYGCVCYVRYCLPGGGFDVTFVMARARVAPVKTVTLPRLELLGCLLAARLARHVSTALELSSSVPVFCWTDSTVALAWVRSSPAKWKQFVRNRVGEIQELTDPSSWGHVSGTDNPADAASRGLMADQLISSSLWLRGPEWLLSSGGPPAESQLFVTSEELADGESEDREDTDRELSTQASADVSFPPAVLVSQPGAESRECVFPVERWSSLTKAVRVAAWVRRFVQNLRHPESRDLSAELSYGELCRGKAELIRQTQRAGYCLEYSALELGKSVSRSSPLYRLAPYLAEDGLIRRRGRLQMSDLSADEKHPIILPKCHLSLLIIRFHHRLMSHAGVGTLLCALRRTYWIVSARRIARSVKRECLACQRQDSPPCCEPSGPLPRVRVTESSPFSVTGIDFAGPLFSVDQPGKKFYICLFTCGTTRAIHLELTDALSLPAFVMALKRFAARRGWPAVIYSDNAATFKACAARLRDTMADSAPEWRFIVPSAPWYGGWWERLVRSVKVGLRKVLGRRCLTRAELETVLHEIESCINSRPLTYVTDDSACDEPLTPNHFLIGRGSVFGPAVVEDPENVSVNSLCQRESVRRSRLEQFWRVWRDDYVRNLPALVPNFKSRGGLRVGSVVMIHRDNVPRLQWPWGTVERLHPGKDGIVRSVDVRTCKGVYTCAVQRLHSLEIVDTGSDLSDGPRDGPDGVTSVTDDGTGVTRDSSCVGSRSCANGSDDVPSVVEGEGASYRTRSGRVSRPPARY